MRDRKTFHDRSLSENCVTLVKRLMDEAVHIFFIKLFFFVFFLILFFSGNTALPLDSDSKLWSFIFKRGSRGVYSVLN